MNKVILGLILAVCVLGMALVMLNERLGRDSGSSPREQAAGEQLKPEAARPQASSSYTAPAQKEIMPAETGPEDTAPPMRSPSLEAAIGLEQENAESALSPEPTPDVSAIPPIPEIPETSAETPAPEPAKPAPEPIKSTAEPAKPAPEPERAPVVESRPAPKPAPQPAQTVKKDQEKAAPAKDGKIINRFVIYSRDKGATVRIGGNGKISYKSMVLENPNRVVLDLDGEWQFPPNPGVPKNDLVSNVRIGRTGDKTRVVIDLKEKPRSTRVLPKGDGLDVRVDK